MNVYKTVTSRSSDLPYAGRRGDTPAGPHTTLFEQGQIYASWSMSALRMSEATPAWLGLVYLGLGKGFGLEFRVTVSGYRVAG